jgi:FkbM family methyltransferase
MMLMAEVRSALRKAVKRSRLAYVLLYPAIRLRRMILTRAHRAAEKSYGALMEFVEGGSLVVRAPDFAGSFELGFRSETLKRLLLSKCYEPELVEVARRHVDPRKDVLDIGANVGLFTVLFSKIVTGNSRVLAVEPSSSAVEYLRRNIQRNGCTDRVTVFEGAATDRAGRCGLNVIPGKEEYSSLGDITHPAVKGEPHRAIEVMGDTIDNLVAAFALRPGFMKIDTEGAEFLVLSGAINTLRTCRPAILCELADLLLSNFGHTSTRVIALLQENGYAVTDPKAPQAPVRAPFNGEILAVPVGSH